VKRANVDCRYYASLEFGQLRAGNKEKFMRDE